MALVEVKVPDIGDFDEVAVIELMVKVGDTIKAEQSLITVESDKAAMEIPSSTELRVKLGDKVKQGSVVLVLEASGAVSVPAEVPAVAAPAAAPAVQSAPVAAPATDAVVSVTSSIVAAAPAHNPGAPTLGLPHAMDPKVEFHKTTFKPLPKT
ncbi:MAG: dihydrolipoyllysine-residue acetyltransferase [Pseudomonadota bacterium]